MNKTPEIGFVIFAIGIIALFYALTFDTTVLSSDGQDLIYNTGLLNNRLIYTIASCTAILTGTIMLVCGHIINLLEEKKKNKEP